MARANIVVAGAGAVGSAAALALARAGHAVTVVDPAGVNASAIAAGMLAPAFEALFDDPDRFALLVEARDRWPALAASIGLPLSRGGAVAVGSRADAEAWADSLRGLGADAALRPPGAGPAWIAPGLWGAFTPDDWRLDAPTALLALRRAGEAAGVRFVAGEVAGFEAGVARLADGRQAAADILVIATGAARTLLAPPELAQLTPIKGHILRAAAALPGEAVVRAPGVYVCPGEEIVLGATMEPGRDDASVDDAEVAGLIARAAAIAPALTDLDWRAETGVRAATPDGLPLVGWSRAAGVIVAAGARRNGWLLAPMIAEAVTAAVAGAAPDARFDPQR